MPHLICEYSADHDPALIREILLALHDAADATGIVKGKDLKIRGRVYEDYLFAGRVQSFFHLGLHLMEGRTAEQKRALSQSVLAALISRLPATVSISVELKDMERTGYSKRVLEN